MRDQPGTIVNASVSIEGERLLCRGHWTAAGLHAFGDDLGVAPGPGGPLSLDCAGIEAADTAGAWFLYRSLCRLRASGREVEAVGMSEDLTALLKLVRKHDPGIEDIPRPHEPGFLEDIGRDSLSAGQHALAFLAFIGDLTFTSLRILLTPARLRWRQVMINLETAGFDALPIVGLLSFLMGIVIAYQGGVLLRQYGASLFIADLVGLAMLRELAPLMTAIIVAGRTGSAYTAEIATMQVTEEVDALRTMGITPLEMLALPKLFGLVVALPLLTVFADLLGVIGGMVMANGILDVSFKSFVDRFTESIGVEDFLIGIGKAPVFAAIIAAVACYQGFQVEGGAESVGRRTTISVVHSIFLVIVVDAAFSVIFSKLGI